MLRKIRLGRKVTSFDLTALQCTQQSHVLYCRRCHGTYSADHADYSFYYPALVFKCCGVNNWLLEK